MICATDFDFDLETRDSKLRRAVERSRHLERKRAAYGEYRASHRINSNRQVGPRRGVRAAIRTCLARGEVASGSDWPSISRAESYSKLRRGKLRRKKLNGLALPARKKARSTRVLPMFKHSSLLASCGKQSRALLIESTFAEEDLLEFEGAADEDEQHEEPEFEETPQICPGLEKQKVKEASTQTVETKSILMILEQITRHLKLRGELATKARKNHPEFQLLHKGGYSHLEHRMRIELRTRLRAAEAEVTKKNEEVEQQRSTSAKLREDMQNLEADLIHKIQELDRERQSSETLRAYVTAQDLDYRTLNLNYQNVVDSNRKQVFEIAALSQAVDRERQISKELRESLAATDLENRKLHEYYQIKHRAELTQSITERRKIESDFTELNESHNRLRLQTDVQASRMRELIVEREVLESKCRHHESQISRFVESLKKYKSETVESSAALLACKDDMHRKEIELNSLNDELSQSTRLVAALQRSLAEKDDLVHRKEEDFEQFRIHIFNPVQVQHSQYSKILSECRRVAVELAKLHESSNGEHGLPIPLRRMGEIDPRKMGRMRVEEISHFQEIVYDRPHPWMPWKVKVGENGQTVENVDYQDTVLRRARRLGSNVAVLELLRAKRELESHNASGSYSTVLPWNERTGEELQPADILQVVADVRASRRRRRSGL